MMSAFPSSKTSAKSIFETCIVYIHVYLLRGFFFPVFAGTLLHFLAPTVNEWKSGKDVKRMCSCMYILLRTKGNQHVKSIVP